MDGQQSPAVQHRKLQSMPCDMKRIYICITESLFYRAEIKHNTVNQLYFNKIKKKVYRTHSPTALVKSKYFEIYTRIICWKQMEINHQFLNTTLLYIVMKAQKIVQ